MSTDGEKRWLWLAQNTPRPSNWNFSWWTLRCGLCGNYCCIPQRCCLIMIQCTYKEARRQIWSKLLNLLPNANIRYLVNGGLAKGEIREFQIWNLILGLSTPNHPYIQNLNFSWKTLWLWIWVTDLSNWKHPTIETSHGRLGATLRLCCKLEGYRRWTRLALAITIIRQSPDLIVHHLQNGFPSKTIPA